VVTQFPAVTVLTGTAIFVTAFCTDLAAHPSF